MWNKIQGLVFHIKFSPAINYSRTFNWNITEGVAKKLLLDFSLRLMFFEATYTPTLPPLWNFPPLWVYTVYIYIYRYIQPGIDVILFSDRTIKEIYTRYKLHPPICWLNCVRPGLGSTPFFRLTVQCVHLLLVCVLRFILGGPLCCFRFWVFCGLF